MSATVIGELSLNNAVYYTQNENTITLCNGRNKSQLAGSIAVWNTLIQASFQKLLENNSSVYYKGIDSVRVGFLNSLANDPRHAQFRVYYTPLDESVSLATPKTEPQENQFTIPFSQQQPIVSSQAMGKNMQAMANRTGVPVRIVTRKTAMQSTWQLFVSICDMG